MNLSRTDMVHEMSTQYDGVRKPRKPGQKHLSDNNQVLGDFLTLNVDVNAPLRKIETDFGSFSRSTIPNLPVSRKIQTLSYRAPIRILSINILQIEKEERKFLRKIQILRIFAEMHSHSAEGQTRSSIKVMNSIST